MSVREISRRTDVLAPENSEGKGQQRKHTFRAVLTPRRTKRGKVDLLARDLCEDPEQADDQYEDVDHDGDSHHGDHSDLLAADVVRECALGVGRSHVGGWTVVPTVRRPPSTLKRRREQVIKRKRKRGRPQTDEDEFRECMRHLRADRTDVSD